MRPSVRLIAQSAVRLLQDKDLSHILPVVANLLVKYRYHHNFELFMYHLKREYANNFLIQPVNATLAYSHNEKALLLVEAKLSEVLDSQILLSIHIKPEIIGGIIIETPDKYLDASVRGALLRMS